MRKKQTDSPVLGVVVTDRAVHAALVASGAGGIEVRRSFTRQRSAEQVEAHVGGGGQLPDVQEKGGEDFTLQFGEGAGDDANNMFLGSEFGDFDKEAGLEALDAGGGNQHAQDFVLELTDILAECRDAGYDSPTLAFCTAASEVEHTEVFFPSEDADGRIKKKHLYKLLVEQKDVAPEQEEVVFLPMTSVEKGEGRYLALYAKSTEPVVPTLDAIHREQPDLLPPVDFIDVETTLYAGLARRGFESAEAAGDVGDDVSTLVVRTGSEDTLVTFLKGGQVHHIEHLRNLTSFDATETICSRVLLIQDENAIGEVSRVLVLGEDQQEEMVESFASFFPHAQVTSMQSALPAEAVFGEAAVGPAIAAVGVAIRVLDEEQQISTFDGVDFLPAGLLRRRIKMPFSWQSVAALVALFFTVFFFMWRFFSLQGDMQAVQAELDRYRAQPIQEDPQVLQARIDSLQSASQELITALQIIDELLVGSDQWSRALERTSRDVASVSHIWIDSWTPQESAIQLKGSATDRDRIVNLAERTDAAIEDLTFSEIREWPVYSFTLTVPLEKELPRAARYLRQQLAMSDSAADSRVPATTASLKETP